MRWDTVLRVDDEAEVSGLGMRVLPGGSSSSPSKREEEEKEEERFYSGIRRMHAVLGTQNPGRGGLVPTQASSRAAVDRVCGMETETPTSRAEKRRRKRGVGEGEYVIWSSDFHTGPIGDLKRIWGGLRVHGKRLRVIDMSLSGDCGRVGTCAGDGLDVINSANGQDFGPVC